MRSLHVSLPRRTSWPGALDMACSGQIISRVMLDVCMALHDSILLAALTSLYPPYPVVANQGFRSVKQRCIRA